MNKTTRLLGSLLIITIATSCGTGDKNQSAQTDDPLANSPIVGQYVQAGTDKVMSCDQKLLADTVRIPLSFFTEKLEIVKLDSRDEALVGQTGVTISDNYILVHGRRPNPFKLFDRRGNFLTNIGAIGQGPGEYQMVYDAKLDEANNRIYILPWNASQLLVYDLQGNVLDPIPPLLALSESKIQCRSYRRQGFDSSVAFQRLCGRCLDTGFERKQARLHGTGTFGSTAGLQ